MERTAGKVKSALFDAKHPSDRSFLVAIFLSIFFCASFVFARDRTDFLIVEKPQNLSILNKYQQQATHEERELFVPFVPIKILESDNLLADGFTHCMKVVIEGGIYFLLKNSDGKLARTGMLGFEKTFHSVTVLTDTVQILRNNSIRCSPINSRSFQLRAGEKVFRIFRSQNETYCKILDTSSTFGWINFAGTREGKDWKKLLVITSANTSVPSDISEHIKNKIDEQNRLLARLFEYFNFTTHQQKLPPQWKVQGTENQILCTLQDSSTEEHFHSQRDGFLQSTLYLVNDIQNLVLGSNLQVEHSPGRIAISSR